MANTMAELFGKTDVIEDCRKAVHNGEFTSSLRSRITAELILKDGTRRIFRCRSNDRQKALHEVLTFVEAVEGATGERVIWRFKGEKTYRFGSEMPVEFSKSWNFKIGFRKLLAEFFDLD
ncbi:DUF6018 family natural product bioysynthesis protein [Aquibacillus sp. 3ASR75-11]|uniref:DUF6018 family natural product bioysynthesis protein n=1 Tax=Terrihalobacillus insolitus TaxID=2950438 RepID=A0A9X3WR54_9BACI|nr:DUF6018 family natural product bioysynthesis protein [Terrihalobacillus insolitus]MDC3424367.1 DUF6018 family natural product bioysynthesis protein [Terrihalobacillus insolitus]